MGLWSGRGARAGSRTVGTRLRPLFRRAGLRTRAARGRQSAPPAAGGTRPERGAGCGAAACPAPLARARRQPAMPGFDYKFLEKPKRRLLCPLCGKPMREPVQVSTCGHRFCDTCLQEFLRCDPGSGGLRCRGRGHCTGKGSAPRHVGPLSARPPGDLRSAHHDVKGRQ